MQKRISVYGIAAIVLLVLLIAVAISGNADVLIQNVSKLVWSIISNILIIAIIVCIFRGVFHWR